MATRKTGTTAVAHGAGTHVSTPATHAHTSGATAHAATGGTRRARRTR